MYETIVVGTDGSPTAGEAVRHAVRLASVFGATLHVVSAVKTFPLAYAAPETGTASAQIDAEARAQTRALVQSAVDDAAKDGVRAQAHVVNGDPSEALCEVAEQVGASVIVVGNRGMTGAKRFLLGSVPDRVSHHAQCSVLIVRTT